VLWLLAPVFLNCPRARTQPKVEQDARADAGDGDRDHPAVDHRQQRGNPEGQHDHPARGFVKVSPHLAGF